MFDFIKKLFGFKTECNCGCCSCKCDGPDIAKDLTITYSRKGYEIILPVDIATELEENGLTLSATKYNDKPSCVQMFKVVEGKSKYIGTLKTYMNVKSFKDGNVCNFNRNNLIYREEK